MTYHTFRPDGNVSLKQAIDKAAKGGFKVVQVFSNGHVNPDDLEGWWFLASLEAK